MSATNEAWRGKIGKLDRDELNAFLAEGIVCRIATLDADGWPYVVPAWFEWEPEAGVFWVIGREKSAWAQHMVQNPRVAITIDDDGAPYRKLQGQGLAEIVETPNTGGAWVAIARRMAVRYLGEHGADYLEPTLDKPRWLIKITPTRMQTWQGVEWAKRYRERKEAGA